MKLVNTRLQDIWRKTRQVLLNSRPVRHRLFLPGHLYSLFRYSTGIVEREM